MASLKHLSTTLFRLGAPTLRRELSVGTRACIMAGVNPVPAVLPEAGQELQALKAKEKGPWKDLTREEKIELYRSTFPLTMVEAEEGEPQGKTITLGVVTCILIGATFFAFLRKYVGPEPPRSINEEWRKASVEKMKAYRMNPISGVSSK